MDKNKNSTLEQVITKACQLEWSGSEQGAMTGASDSGEFGIKQAKKFTSNQNQKGTNSGSSKDRCKYSEKQAKHNKKEGCCAFGEKCNKCSRTLRQCMQELIRSKSGPPRSSRRRFQ